MDLEALARNLESIERQVDRMNGLVNDLLSVSRAGRGMLDMDRAPFDLAAELRDVVGRYVAATREEGRHSFTVDSPETLTYDGDQTRIDQLLMNLIGNAVKYSPRGGQVAVRLARQDDTAEIAISDQGIGIPMADLTRLGSAFTRGIGRPRPSPVWGSAARREARGRGARRIAAARELRRGQGNDCQGSTATLNDAGLSAVRSSPMAPNTSSTISNPRTKRGSQRGVFGSRANTRPRTSMMSAPMTNIAKRPIAGADGSTSCTSRIMPAIRTTRMRLNARTSSV